jgi:predicted metal-dependent hydrolase
VTSTTTLNVALPSGRRLEAVVRARRGAKRMTLRLDALSGRVLVHGPPRLSQREVLGFITSNSGWIEQRLGAVPPSAPFAEGAHILFRGRQTLLVRAEGRGSPKYRDGVEPGLTLHCTPARFEAHVKAALKAFAQNDALAFCDQHGAKLGKMPGRISLRDTRSRWGSCTSKGDIMLSWRLIGAPPRVFDYVVAHEMCHLLEMNHSPRFWGHVEALMPDWRNARTWLKAHGASLHALGR